MQQLLNKQPHTPGSSPTPSRVRPLLLGAQAIAALALASGSAGAGLLAAHITGDPTSSTLPVGALVVGAGVSAMPLTRMMARRGRSQGLSSGYLLAASGAGLVITSAALGSLVLLLLGHLLIGAGNTAVMLTRYVIADMADEAHRARAIGTSLLVVAAGAVSGPLLLGPAAGASTRFGLPDSAGLYIVAVALFTLAALIPVRAGVEVSAGGPPRRDAISSEAEPHPGNDGDRRSEAHGLATLGAANLTMVSVMAVVPVHLHHHGSNLRGVGMALSAHIAAMFVASTLWGRMADRFGPTPVAAIGVTGLVLAGILPALGGADSLGAAAVLLVLLGLGWNALVVAGSAILSQGASLRRRMTLQARGEVAMSVGAAVGCFAFAGPLLDLGGLPLLAAATVPLNLLLLAALLARRVPARPPFPSSPLPRRADEALPEPAGC